MSLYASFTLVLILSCSSLVIVGLSEDPYESKSYIQLSGSASSKFVDAVPPAPHPTNSSDGNIDPSQPLTSPPTRSFPSFVIRLGTRFSICTY